MKLWPCLLLLILFLFSLSSPGLYGMDLEFSSYPFMFDSTFQMGYPTHWEVSEYIDESYVFASITRSHADDSEGFFVFLVPFPEGSPVENKEQFSEMMIQFLQGGVLPTLTVTREYQHQNIPLMHVVEVHTAFDRMDFQGISWSSFVQEDTFGLGIFILFYAPSTMFSDYNVDRMIAGVFSPMIGMEIEDIIISEDREILREDIGEQLAGSIEIVAIFQSVSGERTLVAIDPSSHNMRPLNEPTPASLLSLTTSEDSSLLVLPIGGLPRVILMSYPDLEEGDYFDIVTGGEEIHISHPTISHDGELIALRVKGLSIAGTIDSFDWSSGAYVGSFTAIASDVSILAYDLVDKSLKISYLSRDMLDMGDKVPLAPAFSPTEDLLAVINHDTLLLMEGSTGRLVKEVLLGADRPIDISGLTWSPDGKNVAYFQRRVLEDDQVQYMITRLDPVSEERYNLYLPTYLRPASIGAIASPATLDFSPDGLFIVFCGEVIDPSVSSIIEDFGRLEVQSSTDRETNLYIYDIRRMQVMQITTDGRIFDPVWKGR